MEPLANQIRPLSLDEFVGQTHLVGPGKPLRLAIEQGHIFSFVLWGTPGTGKTTLARIYANAINAAFYELSAVSAGKDDIRKIINSGKSQGRSLSVSEGSQRLALADAHAGRVRGDGRAALPSSVRASACRSR